MINVLGKRLNLKRSFFFFVNLVSTITWCIFNSQFYQLTDGVAMGGPASSATAENYIQVHEYASISMALYKSLQTYATFSVTSKSSSNIKFSMEEERNGEQVFCDTLLKQNNGRVSVLVYRKFNHANQYLYYGFRYQAGCKKSALSSMFNRAYPINTNKDDLTKKKLE